MLVIRQMLCIYIFTTSLNISTEGFYSSYSLAFIHDLRASYFLFAIVFQAKMFQKHKINMDYRFTALQKNHLYI